jgi:hypothetical protein
LRVGGLSTELLSFRRRPGAGLKRPEGTRRSTYEPG